MAKLYDNDGLYFFDPEIDGQLPYQLHEDNCFINLHRSEPIKDRFCVEDPYDPEELFYQFWRYDQGESFDHMQEIALSVGSVLMRELATVELNEFFDKSHQFTDKDWQELEGAV